MDEEVGFGEAWTRPAVTYRLSERRKRDLLLLARDELTRRSPTAAIDQAIDAALAARATSDSISLDSAALAEQVAELCSSHEKKAQEQRIAISEVARHVKDLRDAMLAVAEQAPDETGDGEATSLREWLRAEAQSLPSPSLLATARWQAKSRSAGDSFLIDVLVERVAASGLSGDAARGRPALARIGPVGWQSPFAKLDALPSAYLMCERSGAAWDVSLHPLLDGGAPGESLGVARI